MKKVCFVCGCQNFISEFEGRAVKEHHFWRCKSCNIVTAEIKGQPTTETYFDDYGDYLTSSPSSIAETLSKKLKHNKKLFDNIQAEFGKNAKVLDFGCGAGFMVMAARRYGLRCDGLEISDHLCRFAQDQLKFKPFRTLIQTDADYDVVYMDNVIEHLSLSISRELINEILDHLRPNGLLMGRVPNFRSANMFLLREKEPMVSPPSHSVYYDKASINKYFSTFGLERCQLVTQGFNVANLFRPKPDEYSFLERPKNQIHRVLALPLRVVGKITGYFVSFFGAGYMIYFSYRKKSTEDKTSQFHGKKRPHHETN